jgi:hypothetical protein
MTEEAVKEPEPQKRWIVRHRWKLGLAAASLLGFWWQRSRRRRIVVDRVSEDWLMQHEFEAGREPKD